LAKRRVLLVDDEVTVLLTLKAVLEISGFDVDTAASAREARSKIKLREYQMVITDMRMESDAAGREVIQAARTAAYHPAVALLTAFPDDDWADLGADKMLVKPMQTSMLIRQIEKLRQRRVQPHPSSRKEEICGEAASHQEVSGQEPDRPQKSSHKKTQALTASAHPSREPTSRV